MNDTRRRHLDYFLYVVLIFGGLLLLASAGRFGREALSPFWRGFWAAVQFVGLGAPACAILALPVRTIAPTCSWVRIGLFTAAVLLGTKAGLSYVHMCLAGSRLVEWSAVIGTPIVAGVMTSLIGRLWLGATLAGCLVALVWLLSGPYLAWAHRGGCW